ncbi:MAG: oligosaccharide flippase family protein [Flavobacteriales bacterium]|nr:oligosaccharide flippase family protein [Flavobacteriales bacterium]
MIFKKLKKEAKFILEKSVYVRQAGILFGSQIGVLLFGVLIKVLQTRTLSVEEYGTYAFFGSINSFLVIFYRFGFYTSIKVLLARTSDLTKTRELIGTGLIIALLIGVSFSSTIFGLSFFVDGLFKVEIGKILLIISPLCFVIPFKMFVSEVGVGANQIKPIALFDVFSTALFLLIISLFYYNGDLTVQSLITYNLLSFIIALLITIKMLNPSFNNIKLHTKEIIQKNKEYGWHYYTGAIANQSTFKLDELFITYFINITQLGFYSLANMICSPISIMSAAMSKSMFKKMASLNGIPNKLFLYNTSWLITCVIGLYFVAEIIVSFLFGAEYSDVALYVIPLSIAHLFRGLSAPYTFLSAKSMGKEIRNVSLAEAIVNVFGNIILIPLYGVMGAIIASIIARFVHYAGSKYYYHKFLTDD